MMVVPLTDPDERWRVVAVGGVTQPSGLRPSGCNRHGKSGEKITPRILIIYDHEQRPRTFHVVEVFSISVNCYNLGGEMCCRKIEAGKLATVNQNFLRTKYQ